ncbi:hypothetical protein WS93_28035 [Burkholderia cepacia]|nr:hypothetical protein WS93_28035 [Burkholderia cepacia]
MYHRCRQQSPHILDYGKARAHLQNKFDVSQQRVTALIMKPASRTCRGEGLAWGTADHDVNLVI